MNIQNVFSPAQAPQPELYVADAVPTPSRAQTQAPPVQQKAEPTPQQVQQAVQNINRTLKTSSNTALEFSVDQGTHATVVKIVDTESGELIRQIPSDAALAIAESIGEFQKGLLLRQQA